MTAEVPPIVTDLGTAAASIAAILGLIGLVVGWASRSFRREVGELVDAKLAPIRDQLRPNGGSSLRDRVDDCAGEIAEMRRLREADELVRLERQAHLDQRLDRFEQRLEDGDERMTGIAEDLARLGGRPVEHRPFPARE